MFTTSARAASLAALFTLVVAFSRPVRGAENSDAKVVCYYTNWSVYRPGTAKFSPQNINPYLCTHLIYAFGGFTKENSLKPFDKYQDIEKGGYAKFTGLKTYNKKLKTMLAIGGWNEGSSRFSPMVASSDRRKELIRNSIKFLRQNHFDGLDLDWEYPSFRDGGKPRDRDNYAQLVQELREEFDRESQKTGRPRLLLTMAVPAGLEYIDKGYDIPKLNKYLDWMNILSYDYHSAFEPAVNHHSPLYSLTESEDDEYNFDSDLNIDATIKHYIKSGADREKLVLGIPTYGRSYTLFNPDANEIGSPADGPGDMGDATRENGYLAYYEICENVKSENWKVMQPNPRAMGPYAYKGNQWVGYDDEQIVKRKAQYVSQMGLGGLMFWAIDNDDFRGVCHGKPYPLIEAAKEALQSASTDNLVVTPPKRTRLSSSSKESTTKSSIVRNSGGRQSFSEEETTKATPRNRKRIRTGSSSKNSNSQPTRKSGGRRRTRPTTTTSTTTPIPPSTTSFVATRSTTPEPPTTPDPGSDFKCEDEGFFPHPRDCKKYFWCLSSGPSELGIIAHQFTCPSGLYFNKAADSCDYTQNVLCNKKKKSTTTTATTTTTTSTTTELPISTSRKPPKITAATSRTTYLSTPSTTATPEYEDEYEYEDEEIEEEDGKADSEEDPRVIKELIDLIKKVGGIEELERHLKLQEDGSATVKNNDFTTPATISRSLYERVLSQTGTASPFLTTLTTRNVLKGRPQYTTIQRNRSQSPREESVTEETDVEEEEEEEDIDGRVSTSRPNTPEYVTIRRNRPSTTTVATTELDYVTIRRGNRPQEEPTTSKYTTIIRRRPTTEEPQQDEPEKGATEKTKEDLVEAQTIKPEEPLEVTSDKPVELVGVSVQLPSIEGVLNTETTVEPSTIANPTDLNQPTDEPNPVIQTTEKPIEKSSTPQLFKPRPFIARPRPTKTAASSTTTEAPSTTTRKVSVSSQRTVLGNRGNSRFKVPTRTRVVQVEPTPNDDEYVDINDEDAPNRTYRPTALADLSSLTSADIAFSRDPNRKHIRRRPTTTTTTTTTTEKPAPGLRTSSRTIPLARKNLLASLDANRNTRRIIKPSNETPTEKSPAFKTVSKQETESERPKFRPPTLNDSERPKFRPISTTLKATIQVSDLETEKPIKYRPTTSKDDLQPETTQRFVPISTTELEESEIPGSTTQDVEGTEASTEEVFPIIKSDETQEPSFKKYATIVRNRPTESSTSDPQVDTTPFPIDSTGSDTDNDYKISEPEASTEGQVAARTRKIIKRIRPTTALPPNRIEEPADSESNRGIIKRIRPLPISGRDEIDDIKLSESNISDGTRIGINGLQEEGKTRVRKKIIRKVRPGTLRNEENDNRDNTGFKRTRIYRPTLAKQEEDIPNEEDAKLLERPRLFRPELLKARNEENNKATSRRAKLFKSDLPKEPEEKSEDNTFSLRRQRIRPIFPGTKLEEETADDSELPKRSRFRPNNSKTEDEISDNPIRNRFRPNSSATEEETTEEKIIFRPTTSETHEENENGDQRNPRILRPSIVKQEDVDEETDLEDTKIYRPIISKDEETNEEGIKRPSIFRSPNKGEEIKNEKSFRAIRIKQNFEGAPVQEDTAQNRTRKIIRLRLRPSVPTTTENEVIEATTRDENKLFETTPEDIVTESVTPESNDIETEATDIGEDVTELTTEDFTTTEEPTTTTTHKPRSTVASLTGRPRPAYRPRGRTPTTPNLSSTTATPAYRRKFNFRSTTARAEITTVSTTTTTTTTEAPTTTSENPTTQAEITTTQEDTTIDTTSEENPIESVIPLDTTSEPITQTEGTTQSTTTISTTTEAEITTTTLANKIEEVTIALPLERETEFPEQQTTLLPANELIVETTSEVITTQEQDISTTIIETTPETVNTTPEEGVTVQEEILNNTSELVESTSVAPESTTNDVQSTTESSESLSSTSTTSSYKPIRYKPGDRPKLRFNLNRPESDQSTTEDTAPRKFVPARPANQRPRFSYQKLRTTEAPETIPVRKFVPQGRKLEYPKLNTREPTEEAEEQEADDEVKNDPPTEEDIEDQDEELEADAELEAEEPINEVQEPAEEVNKPVNDVREPLNFNRPSTRAPQNVPFRKSNQPVASKTSSKNYNRKFANKPIYASTPSTTTSIQPDLLNARNKQLYSTPRKMNVPHKPSNEELPSTSNSTEENIPVEHSTESAVTEVSQDNKEIVSSNIEEINLTDVPIIPENVPITSVNAQIIPEILTIASTDVPVVTSTEEQPKPTEIDIPITTSIPSVSEASTSEESVTVPSTSEEIITSTEPQHPSTLHHVFAEIEPVTEQESTSTTPEITPSTSSENSAEANKFQKLVEVNRIVEVSIEENKKKERVQVLNPTQARVGAINRLTVINVVDGKDTYNHATLEDILTGRKIFSSSRNNYTTIPYDSTTVPSDSETKLNILNNTLEIIEADKKFEIFSKSNVVDYSRKIDPIASAVSKQAAPPIIDTAASVNEKSNNVDQDLLESQNGRVRIRILGNEPSYSPIIADNQETVTTKAEVVEVPRKVDEIRIAPISVSIG